MTDRYERNLMLRPLLFILLILPFSSGFAHDSCEIPFVPKVDFSEHQKALEWFAASSKDIKNAHCLRTNPFTEDEMSLWLNSNNSSLKFSETIRGIKFKDESPENLDAFEKLIIMTGDDGEPVKNRIKNYKSKCDKVACALKEIFGETSTQLLFMQRRFGMNGSHLAFSDRAIPWKKSELNEVLLALTDYPEGLLPLEDERPLVRLKGDESNVLANMTITIFNGWKNRSPEVRRSTIVHEIAHIIATKTGLDEDPEWLKQSGWNINQKFIFEEPEKEFKSNRNETLVSEYALKNSWEDLAESVEAYRYNPIHLKNVSPEKYALIKQYIFDNVEYTSDETCRYPNRTSSKIKNEIQKNIKSLTEKDLLERVSPCHETALKILAKDGILDFDSPSLQFCYENALKNLDEIKRNHIRYLPRKELLGPMIRNISLDPNLVSSFRPQIQKIHKDYILQELKKILKDSDTDCDPDFYSYGWQQFDEKKLSIDAYELKDDLNTIHKKACALHFAKKPLNNLIREK